MQYIKFVILFLANTLLVNAYNYDYKITDIDQNQKKITIIFDLELNESVDKDSFYLSTNNPQIKLSQPIISNISGTEKITYTFDVTKESSAPTNLTDIVIHNNFIINNIKEPQEKIIPINFQEKVNKDQEINQVENSTQKQNYYPVTEPSYSGNFMHNLIDYISEKAQTVKNNLSSIFTTTGSYSIKLLIALVLGLLLSLTPCIYPMIPITVGIMQAEGSNSALRSFFLALSYTMGISLTFATLGFITSVSSVVFGELQGNPIIILFIVFVLGYLGFAMFGLYEMYIPRFMQPKGTKIQKGSALSAFIFGAISGTIASPCLSPGLALILNYVSSISINGSYTNYLEGFLLLFVFGIGSSLPLLIIGTFSNAVNLLPRAGFWMVEIKKLLGLMLIGMCFYHLSSLTQYIPWFVLSWIISIFLLIIGIYYIATVTAYDSKYMKLYKNIVGALFIIASCFMAVQSYKTTYDHFYSNKVSKWSHDYQAALILAAEQNKKLFIDIGATYCTACKSIDKNILQNKLIDSALNNYILVKVEADLDQDAFKQVKSDFESYIKGFPTILIVDPKTKEVLQKWDSNLESESIESIVNKLNY